MYSQLHCAHSYRSGDLQRSTLYSINVESICASGTQGYRTEPQLHPVPALGYASGGITLVIKPATGRRLAHCCGDRLLDEF